MSNIPKSWLEWIESEDGKRAADADSLGVPPDKAEYLKNRLWHAFVAGMACEEATGTGPRRGEGR